MIKNLIFLCALVSTLLGSVRALEPGDDVSFDAIRKARLVSGVIPESWESGSLYILECWATWCGPCVAAIPHLDHLYDTYSDKGLAVIGMSVWEDGGAKVDSFVKKKGEGMSYPVVFVGKDGAFEADWLKPAGVLSIPQAIVVRDGKLLFLAHPTMLTEERIQVLLAGGEASEALVDEMQRVARAKVTMAQRSAEFRDALRTSNVKGMKQALDAAESLTIESPYLEKMQLEYALAVQDWVPVEAALEDAPSSTLMLVVSRVERQENVPKALLGAIVTALQNMRTMHGYTYAQIATMKWKMGDSEGALAAARDGVTKIKAASHFAPEPFEQFADALEAGKPMSLGALSRAMQAAAKARSKK